LLGGDVASSNATRILSTTGTVGVWTWPAALIPARTVYITFRVILGTGSYTMSVATLSSAGKFTLYAGPDGSGFNTGNSQSKGPAEQTISYNLN
jgi:hypothetical protein